jgi:DNA-binding transcriptional LysR family regulator
MDLRQLAALVAVADAGSFSAAARALHTVQSNVSTHIARLERELGALLVDRSSGSLTEEGQAVVVRARHVQGELEAIAADVAALRDEVTGNVRIGCIGTVGRWLVPLVLSELADRHPKVRAVVLDATTSSLVPQLLADRLDLALVNLPVPEPEISTEVLFEEDRLVIAPLDHPLAQHERIDIEELTRHDLLLEPAGTAFRDELDAEVARAGLALRPKAEVDGLRLITSLAFEGFGAAIVPATAAPQWLEGRWRRVAVDGLARRTVGLARRRRGLLSAPARAVEAVVRDVVAARGHDLPGVHPVPATPR